MYHSDSKGAITEYIQEKQPQLAKKMSVIYISFYVTDLILYDMMKPRKVCQVSSQSCLCPLTAQHHDSFTIDRLCDGNVKLPFIDTCKGTGPFVKALVELPLGKTLPAYTAMLSFNEITKLWWQATG